MSRSPDSEGDGQQGGWHTMPVSNCLNQILFERALAESELAAAAGLDAGHLNRIKNGRVVPNVATALRLARVLGVSVEAVFEWKPD